MWSQLQMLTEAPREHLARRRAADLRACLHDVHVEPGPSEICRRHQAVVATTDDDHVMIVTGAAS